MMFDYDYDDCFYEPSEFDEKVEEFKDYLRQSVKEEVQQKIERLEKENAELRGVRDNWDKVKRGYEAKQIELERKIADCEYDVKRKRLEGLFEACGMNVILYSAYPKAVYKTKCDKCDENRKVSFYSPSGREYKEDCECAKYYLKYSPSAYYCTEFRVNRHKTKENPYPLMMWFKKYKDCSDDYDGYTYDSSNLCKCIYNGEDFAELEERKTSIYFRDEEDCQKYCDWLNNKNGITDDMEDKR